MTAIQLFVYGTLMHDQPAHQRLAASVVSRTAAVLPRAALFAVGWYPMATAGSGRVQGELLRIRARAWPDLATRLDEYEGDEYARTARLVLIGTDEKPVEAWVYLADPAVARRYPQIADGDWRAYLAGREQQEGGI